ncbi:MAG TPA: hypothetical protein VFQ63_01100 [Patescibacteria group bacterium]|nr:hypothetical protein [Patescibacteria group bacterium]
MAAESDISRALIVRPPELQPFLPSDRQKADVLAFIKNVYLNPRKGGEQPWTPATIEASVGVLMHDALLRGLALEGRDMSSLSENDSLVKPIQAGIENRNLIRSTAQEAVKVMDRYARTTSSTFAGPLALRKDLCYQASQQVNGTDNKGKPLFQITKDIQDANLLAYQYATRQGMLPGLAKHALETLEAQFPQAASIDILKDQTDRANSQRFIENMARITRNMLFSYTLGLPSAFVPVEVLQRLESTTIEARFTEDAFSQIYQQQFATLFDGAPAARAFLHDLYFQTKEEITSSIARRNQLNQNATTEEQQRDNTYRSFNNNFFINEAVLEENQINLSPSQHMEGLDSLWDDDRSVIKGDFRVPTEDSLRAAERQATAVPYLRYEQRQQVGQRFREAIAAWKTLREAEERESAEIGRLTNTLAEKTQHRQRLGEKDQLHPKELERGIQLAHDTGGHKTEVQHYRDSQTIYKRMRNRLARSKRYRETIDAFFTELESQGTLPARIQLPDELRAIFKQIDSHERAVTRGHARHQLEASTDIISRDFFAPLDHLFTYAESVSERPKVIDHWKSLSQADLEQHYNLVVQTLNKTQADPSGTISFGDARLTSNYLDYIQDQLADMRGKKTLSPAKNHRIELYTRLEQEALALQSQRITTIREFPKEIYIDSLTQRIKAIERIMKARSDLQRASKPLSQIPETVSPEVLQVLKTRLYALTLDASTSPQQLDEHLPELNKVDRTDYKFPSSLMDQIPSILPAKPEFAALLGRLQGQVQEHLDHAPTLSKKARLKKDLEIVFQLRHAILYNPLFPEAQGLTWKQLWSSLPQRIYVAEALQKREKNTATLKEDKALMQELALAALLREDERDIALIQKRLAELRDLPAQGKFLEKMGSLGFLVKLPARRD